ncbi:hypothetical protein UFOVP136_11 [uncultured Caudovirales phage]|uniref:Uncharacterized protein n=1 Tax=uncultured Caudovirales phage TaxID=2100421 RepID=A0A6J5LFW7_9CAUD|nr:hypothetical protein UFOVP136_11 [uncultured Caudovirales phage]
MIVGRYGSAGQEIQWERDRNAKQNYNDETSRFTKKICRRCKNTKETKGGTNKNFIFVCKDCNDALRVVK